MGDSPTPDFYSILGISKGASILDVCKAYKSLVKKWHPDKNHSNKTEAEIKFQSINEAYQVTLHLYSHAYVYTDVNPGKAMHDEKNISLRSFFVFFYSLPSFAWVA